MILVASHCECVTLNTHVVSSFFMLTLTLRFTDLTARSRSRWWLRICAAYQLLIQITPNIASIVGSRVCVYSSSVHDHQAYLLPTRYDAPSLSYYHYYAHRHSQPHAAAAVCKGNDELSPLLRNTYCCTGGLCDADTPYLYPAAVGVHDKTLMHSARHSSFNLLPHSFSRTQATSRGSIFALTWVHDHFPAKSFSLPNKNARKSRIH